MKRGSLVGLAVVLTAGVGGLARPSRAERKQRDGIEISTGDHGMPIEKT